MTAEAKEIIENAFNPNVCTAILGKWHRNLYCTNYKSDFRRFYDALDTDSRAVVNKWIMDTLVCHNLWQHWE